jgi:hypothetical protein
MFILAAYANGFNLFSFNYDLQRYVEVATYLQSQVEEKLCLQSQYLLALKSY